MEDTNITVYRDDDMPAYAAWLANAQENVILFNVSAHIRAAKELDVGVKELAMETAMHEFGHALEEWWGLEFSEERVERIVMSYNDREYEEVEHDEKEAAYAFLQAVLSEILECGKIDAARIVELAQNYGIEFNDDYLETIEQPN